MFIRENKHFKKKKERADCVKVVAVLPLALKYHCPCPVYSTLYQERKIPDYLPDKQPPVRRGMSLSCLNSIPTKLSWILSVVGNQGTEGVLEEERFR